jgi:hypothetical protein
VSVEFKQVGDDTKKLVNTRIVCLLVVGGMDDFFTIKEDLFDDYEDELEEVGIFGI